MERITITVIKWEKYNPRKDIKHPTWFALSNRLLEDPDLFDFDPLEFKAYLYILCQASQKNQPNVTVNFAHAERVSNVSKKWIFAACDKLVKIGVLSIDEDPRTQSERARTESVRDRQTDRQTNTTTGGVGELANSGFGPRELAGLWNSRMERVKSMAGKAMSLVRVDRMNPSQDRWKAATARLKEDPSPSFWEDVIDRMARSEWCRGRGTRDGWVATFDFLVKPKTATGVMEGLYGCTPRPTIVPTPPPPEPEPEREPTPEEREEMLRALEKLTGKKGA